MIAWTVLFGSLDKGSYRFENTYEHLVTLIKFKVTFWEKTYFLILGVYTSGICAIYLSKKRFKYLKSDIWQLKQPKIEDSQSSIWDLPGTKHSLQCWTCCGGGGRGEGRTGQGRGRPCTLTTSLWALRGDRAGVEILARKVEETVVEVLPALERGLSLCWPSWPAVTRYLRAPRRKLSCWH